MSKYDDIINLERPISKRRQTMSKEIRAAQFAPFSALTGYSEAIKETARLTDKKRELSDGLKEIISDKLNYIKNNIKNVGDVSITYFVRDTKKSGGKYITITSKVKKIELGYIYMKNGHVISFDDICDVSSEIFDYLEM